MATMIHLQNPQIPLTWLQWYTYYVRHKAETHENWRFFSSGMEFAENAYAYVLKVPSRS